MFKVPLRLITAFEYADYSGLTDIEVKQVKDVINNCRNDVGMYFNWYGTNEGICSPEFGGLFSNYINMTIGYNIEP